MNAIQHDLIASTNNLMSLSIAEDKGLLSVLRDPEFMEGLPAPDRQLIETSVLPTARLDHESVMWKGHSTKLLEELRSHPDRFVGEAGE